MFLVTNEYGRKEFTIERLTDNITKEGCPPFPAKACSSTNTI